MFFTRKEIGRIYVIRMVLPCGTRVHKVGITNSDRATDRVFEILRSWFNHFRYVPYSNLRLDRECYSPLKVETFIHKVLKEYRFHPEYKVQGYTEMFTGVDERKLIHFIKNTYEVPKGLSSKDFIVLGRLLGL